MNKRGEEKKKNEMKPTDRDSFQRKQEWRQDRDTNN
jgi:hypothetical protein